MSDHKSPHTIYCICGKRMLDVVVAVIGILMLAPLCVLLAAAVKLGSKGSIFFRQERVGLAGRSFKILKFRSMVEDAASIGLGITASGDHRVTGVGKFLRRWKLDELPQLWNVLVGEMSLVGPRPELAAYVRHYTNEQRKVLLLRPGITGPASIAYRREEELLAAAHDPDLYYKEVLLPDKLKLNLQYAQSISFINDLRLVLNTLKLIFACSGQLEETQANSEAIANSNKR